MTVNEYRKKHKRCGTCKHFNEGWVPNRCMAKGLRFIAYMRYRGCFCKLYEPKEYRDG